MNLCSSEGRALLPASCGTCTSIVHSRLLADVVLSPDSTLSLYHVTIIERSHYHAYGVMLTGYRDLTATVMRISERVRLRGPRRGTASGERDQPTARAPTSKLGTYASMHGNIQFSPREQEAKYDYVYRCGWRCYSSMNACAATSATLRKLFCDYVAHMRHWSWCPTNQIVQVFAVGIIGAAAQASCLLTMRPQTPRTQAHG